MSSADLDWEDTVRENSGQLPRRQSEITQDEIEEAALDLDTSRREAARVLRAGYRKVKP